MAGHNGMKGRRQKSRAGPAPSDMHGQIAGFRAGKAAALDPTIDNPALATAAADSDRLSGGFQQHMMGG
jgi:hypothetical protein